MWAQAAPIIGSAILQTAGDYINSQAQNKLRERELDMLEDYRAQQFQLDQERMAMEKEHHAAQMAALKKQVIQRAYSELISAALQGGMAEANAMANIGTMGQRAVLGGAR